MLAPSGQPPPFHLDGPGTRRKKGGKRFSRQKRGKPLLGTPRDFACFGRKKDIDLKEKPSTTEKFLTENPRRIDRPAVGTPVVRPGHVVFRSRRTNRNRRDGDAKDTEDTASGRPGYDKETTTLRTYVTAHVLLSLRGPAATTTTYSTGNKPLSTRTTASRPGKRRRRRVQDNDGDGGGGGSDQVEVLSGNRTCPCTGQTRTR